MSRWNKPTKQVDEWCAVRIIPFVLNDDKSVSLLLGVDKHYLELTPFGGSCNEEKGSCSRKDTSTLKKCLTRELTEESKYLLNLDKIVDFVNCKHIHYVAKLMWANMHNNIYFSHWIGSDKETIKTYFNDKKRDDRLLKKLTLEGKDKKEIKSYFEMETIDFIPVNYDIFGTYIYNTIQDFHHREKMYSKDKANYNQIINTFSTILKNYPMDNNTEKEHLEKTDRHRFDPRFLIGLVDSVADYFRNQYKYKNIDDIVDDILLYIKGMKNGCSLDMTKNDFQEITEEDEPI